jgi:predicted phage terminase large subunit-like protein
MRGILELPATSITRGTTYDNLDNLAPAFVDRIVSRYECTRLGRQELMAEMLEDVEGALWTRAMLDDSRITKGGSIPSMSRVVIAVDPAVTSGEDSDETGIIVAAKGEDGHGYIFEDLTCRMSPDGWARRLVKAYHDNSADRIVAEVNNGGDMVEHLVRTVDPSVSYEAVRATRGKVLRAEPVAALYEQGKVHHVGAFAELEDQMCSMTLDGYDGGSPDRVDALVWALTSLMLTGGAPNVRWL